MANRFFTQFFGTLHKKPVMLDCQFNVDTADPSGAGISNFTGAGISAVYMNSTTSFIGSTHTNNVIDGILDTSFLEVGMPIQGVGVVPGTKISAITSATAIQTFPAILATTAATPITYQAPGSPNPAPGYIQVNFTDLYNFYYTGCGQVIAPGSGLDVGLVGLTIGAVYKISDVGTTSTAQWNLLGLPAGFKPTVGQAFVAKAVSAPGTGQVQELATATSAIASMEIVGDPNTTLGSSFVGNSVLGKASGAYILFKITNAAGDLWPPVVGSGITLGFFLSNSSIKVNGS